MAGREGRGGAGGNRAGGGGGFMLPKLEVGALLFACEVEKTPREIFPGGMGLDRNFQGLGFWCPYNRPGGRADLNK